MNIEGLSLHILTTELNQALSGGRISKILQPTRNYFLLKIRQPDQEYTLAVSIEPGDPRVHLTDETRENPLEPSSLCMLMRKHLLDGRIAAVNQKGLDRVLLIPVDIRGGQGRIETKSLIIELAGKNSNLILCSDGIIIDSSRRIGHNTSRVRQIVPGIVYVPPPAPEKHNLLLADASYVVDTIRGFSTASLSKALMASVEGIGPLGTAEILFRAGLSPSQPAGKLMGEECNALAGALRSFREPFSDSPVSVWVILDASGRLLSLSAFEPTHLQNSTGMVHRFDSMSSAIAFAATLIPAPKTNLHQDTARRVRNELDKLERKLILLTQEFSESQNADVFRRNADLLMANLHRIATGTTSIAVQDFFSEEPGDILPEVSIVLNPAWSPMENIQRYYKKYSRGKRAQELINKQIQQCREDIQYLETILLSLSENITNQEVQEIILELIDAEYMQSVKKPKPFSRPSEPRRIATVSGSVIFVGRNNRQNDLVTFKTAQPRDLWFHTKDIPGSHVILRSSGAVPLPGDIEQAAHLAAWFSKSRYSANVPVDYTERRHVKKPAGAKPGFVIYEKQKTLWVTPDASMIEALLQEPSMKPSP